MAASTSVSLTIGLPLIPLPASSTLCRIAASFARWGVVRATVFFMGVYGSFRVIGRVFHAFNRGRFEGLIGVRQFLRPILRWHLQCRKPLRAAGLARAAISDLARIRS